MRERALIGRRACVERNLVSGLCAVWSVVPAQCAVAPRTPSRVRVGSGGARCPGPPRGCVPWVRFAPRPRRSPGETRGPRARRRTPLGPAVPRHPDGIISNESVRCAMCIQNTKRNGQLTKTSAVCCRLLSIVVAGGALCKKRPKRYRAVCFAAVPVALPALLAFLVLLLGAVLLLLLLPSLAL